jgi:hypothetical protein
VARCPLAVAQVLIRQPYEDLCLFRINGIREKGTQPINHVGAGAIYCPGGLGRCRRD